MVADFHLLRDPRFIKVAAISTAVIAVSVGVGLTVAGTRKAPASSLQENNGSGVEAIPKNGATNNGAMTSYLTNSEIDHLDTIDEIVDTSAGMMENETVTVNGYSLYGVYRESDGVDAGDASKPVRTRKCGGVGEAVSGEESSSKSGKVSGGRRRLGWYGGWGNPIVSSGTSAGSDAKTQKTVIASTTKSEKTIVTSSAAKSEKTDLSSSTSSAKSEKTEITSSTSSTKTGKTVDVTGGASSWGAGWGATNEDEPSSWGASVNWDVDCETTVEVVVASKASSSKALKTKSSKVKRESSAKSTSATVASSWERSPPTDVSNVWGSSPTTSPAPTRSSLESLAPVQTSSSVSLCH